MSAQHPQVLKFISKVLPILDQVSQKLLEDELFGDDHVVGLLLDTFDPSARGGTGKSFDWAIASELGRSTNLPFFLAGGLRYENVEEAVRRCRPFGLDVSSGVETEGLKDSRKIQMFVQKANELL